MSSAYREFRQIYPRPGWVEHDPEEIWQSVEWVIRQALSKKAIQPKSIAAIGITNQRETTILWDRKTGKPVHHAIVWQCRRTAALCERLRKDGHEKIFREKTGLVLDAYFSGTKIQWLLQNIKGLRQKSEKGEICFGTIDTWLIWKLTGGKVHATDTTNASRTLIFNIKEKVWDKKLLQIMNIPHQILPEVRPSSSLFGHAAKNICGLLSGTPIAGVAGDQQAALFGQDCFAKGEMKNTYGTGSFLMLNTGQTFIASKKGLLTTLACDEQGGSCFALEGAVFITGAAVQWLRDELKIIQNAKESEALAKSISDAGGVYVVPAFVGLGAPYWDPEARGVIVGLTRGSGRAHIVRATLEAIAYQVKDVVDLMQKETGQALISLKVDGGACSNDFLMQFQADILNIKIIRPQVTETTAKGAALLAGLVVGYWKNSGQLHKTLAVEKVFKPLMSAKKRKVLYEG